MMSLLFGGWSSVSLLRVLAHAHIPTTAIRHAAIMTDKMCILLLAPYVLHMRTERNQNAAPAIIPIPQTRCLHTCLEWFVVLGRHVPVVTAT